jgi:hypothetical protein
VALISFPNYQRTSRMLLPEKCVPFLNRHIKSAFQIKTVIFGRTPQNSGLIESKNDFP